MIFDIIKTLFGTNTPTLLLSDSTIHKIVELTNEWCEKNLGENSSRGWLTIHIKNQPLFSKPTYGGFDVNSNTIIIHQNRCGNVGVLIKAIIHEYVHYLQDVNDYDSLLDEYGYDDHPLEVEANTIMNNYYTIVWNKIKNKI